MLLTYTKKNLVFYYDLEEKKIGRFPTKSNLYKNGSDNNLFFGLDNDKNVCNIFRSLFNVSKIAAIKGMSFSMICGEENVQVELNINAQRQIQIKICKNGTTSRLANDYCYEKIVERDMTKMLLVLDFSRREIHFTDPSIFKL